MAQKTAAEVEGEDGDDPAETQRLADEFKKLVVAAGGPVRVSSLLKRSPNTVHGWTSGRTKIPFLIVLKVAQAADRSLDAFAIGADDDAVRSRGAAPVPVYESSAAVPDGFVTVPALDVQASAGNGSLVSPFDADGTDIVAFREAWLRDLGLQPGRVHIVWARGDSMQPTIRDGDMLLVDRRIDRVLDNGIYIVVVAGAVLVKRLTLRTNGAVVLRSDNERYPEELIPADEVPQLIVEGRVRWVGGPI